MIIGSNPVGFNLPKELHFFANSSEDYWAILRRQMLDLIMGLDLVLSNFIVIQ